MANPVPETRDNDSKQTYGFSARNAERIATAVRRVESKYQNDALSQRRQSPVFAGSGVFPLVITSNVLPGTEADPSPFSAVVLVPSGNNLGWTTKGGLLVTGYNRASGFSFTATPDKPKSAWGVYLQGTLYLVSADC